MVPGLRQKIVAGKGWSPATSRISDVTSAVYVEATATDTEARLLAALHQDCPYLAGETRGLRAAIRRKDLIPSDKKVLVVLDQFEQYLHSTPEDEQDELAEALRECDGGKLQCILMVRDDFLTARQPLHAAIGHRS